MNQEINKYIQKRYHRWHEYAVFQCSLAGLVDQAGDVINEVLLDLLKKDPAKVEGLYSRKKKQYRELDFFVLKMINLNVHSLTSPYRYKYRQPLTDGNANTAFLPFDEDIDNSDPFDDDVTPSQGSALIEDEEPDFTDSNERICARMDILREILDILPVPQIEKSIYSFRHLEGNPFTQWPGPENITYLYEVNRRVKGLIQTALEKRLLSDAIRKAVEAIPRKNDKALARLLFEYGFRPDELREAGFPVKYLFPLYHRMQSEVKALAINYLNSGI